MSIQYAETERRSTGRGKGAKMKTKLILVFLFLIFAGQGMVAAETAEVDTVPADAPQALSEVDSVGSPQVGTYEQLVAAIRKTRAASQARVEQAVRQEKVRECWETGRLIDAHVLQHKERADYGENVLERLSADLGTSRTELSYMLQFARAYPILRTSEELTWSHYESLLALNDDKEREEVSALASKEKWPLKRLREEVKKRKAAKHETAEPVAEEKLTAKLGKPGTYRMVKAKVGPEAGKLVIDLGFSNYYKTSRDLRFKEGAIIEVLFAAPEGGSSPSDKIKLSKRTSADLYTYRAYVHRVLDGDTIEAVIDLGFGVRSVQTLRLRGIDAPELVSKEGKEAKAELERMLGVANSQENSAMRNAQRATDVLIKTIKSDKYDRYLADLFVAPAPNGQGRLRQELDVPVRADVYVNQKMVDEGFAARVRD